MTDAANTLLQQALGLSPEDRIEVAEQLYQSFGDDLLPDDPEFHAELNRRLESIENGSAVLIPWKEAREEIRAELERRRAARQAEKQT
jgi:putative addiction module component (TIGR02574 family)